MGFSFIYLLLFSSHCPTSSCCIRQGCLAALGAFPIVCELQAQLAPPGQRGSHQAQHLPRVLAPGCKWAPPRVLAPGQGRGPSPAESEARAGLGQELPRGPSGGTWWCKWAPQAWAPGGKTAKEQPSGPGPQDLGPGTAPSPERLAPADCTRWMRTRSSLAPPGLGCRRPSPERARVMVAYLEKCE